MARTTVAVEHIRTMFVLLSVFVFVALPARAFLPVAPLTDCPKIPPRNDFKIEELIGTWRLAYLYLDDKAELEEDTTCAISEIMQVNDTQLQLLLYVDGRKDEFTLERFTKEFDLTVLTPGKWILHTSFLNLKFLQVTVIGFSLNHLVLTFCVDPFEEDLPPTAKPKDYESFLNTIDRESIDDIFKAQRYFQDLSSLSLKHRRLRRPSRLLRGKREAADLEKSAEEESTYEKVLKYFEQKENDKPKKHLWTIILVKNNDNSALKFVENASLLIKYGFKVTEGQLVSFGGCNLTKK